MNEMSTAARFEDASPTVAPPMANSDDLVECDGLLEQASAIAAAAGRSDEMCLNAASQLGAAMPDLESLSKRFQVLSSLLTEGESLAATERLQRVAEEISGMGNGLVAERQTLLELITLNGALAARIEEVTRNIRFVVAIVANVKIEIATIDRENLRLASFVDDLTRLTEQSQRTLSDFESTQRRLVKQLRDALRVQKEFEATQQGQLLTACTEIQAILDTLSARRRFVGGLAGEIGVMTSRINSQIGASIVALQVGDSARQRLEHVGEALALAAAIDGGVAPEVIGEVDEARRCTLVSQIVRIQIGQLEHVTADFPAEIGTVETLLREIAQACACLLEASEQFGSSQEQGSDIDVAQLEKKLASARDLVNQSRRSRQIVDETADHVARSVAQLEGLAKKVASMALDMTIVGTNAVVTSHRFGTRGAALSVIAQHLRAHALHVADELARIRPILADVLRSGASFASSRQGQDASSMGEASAGMTQALETFHRADRSVTEVREGLRLSAASVGGVLQNALRALADVTGLVEDLTAEKTSIEHRLSSVENLFQQPDEALLPLVRRKYTMQTERDVFDEYTNAEVESQDRVSEVSGGDIDDFLL